MKQKSPALIYLCFFAVLILCLFLSCFFGRMQILASDVLNTLIQLPSLITHAVSGSLYENPDMNENARALMLIRIPRILMAMMVGAGLSVSGAVYQGLFRNPLVSPDILGVAAGCTFGAALGLLIPGSSFFVVRLLSFAMGICAVATALAMARAVRTSRTLILVLTGVITGSLFHAFFMIIKTVADPLGQLPAIVFWVMGSLSGGCWGDVVKIAPVVLCGYSVFHLYRYRLNVLSLGDDTARTMGINPGGLRLFLISISSLVVAVCVAACGQIAWVGLVIPHIVRTMLGPNHRLLIPCSALLGGSFLILADDIARSALSSELPLGVITSLIGAPVFAWLLYKNKNRGWK